MYSRLYGSRTSQEPAQLNAGFLTSATLANYIHRNC